MTTYQDVASWTVLIVDDEEKHLQVVEKALAYYGAHVYTASNGKEGLQLLNYIQPTMVLLDLSMPQMDGWTTLQSIRQNPETAHLLVVALSAHAMDSDMQRAAAEGFNGYIIKPFRLVTLLAEMKAYIAQHYTGYAAATV